MSVLSEILATKRTEVNWARERIPLEALQAQLAGAPPVRSFRDAIVRSEGNALIAEVKKASPSKGVIREDFDAVEIAGIYETNGATCLSVLTDARYFQGSLDNLRQIRGAVGLPLLRKDFMVDAWQIVESRVAGADAVLLIVAALSPEDLRSFLKLARELGLAVLVEVHDREELEEALDAGADIIGINNRDLHTFRTNLQVTYDLMPILNARPDLLVVSESGISKRIDVEKLEAAGVDAVLIGESLMSAPDIGLKVRELLGTVVPAVV